MNEMPPEELRNMFHWSEDRSFLIWKPREPECFSTTKLFKLFQSRVFNKKAGFLRKDGYRQILINRKPFLEHRVIWCFEYGYWPTDIDHIDGDKSNNQLSNLREVTKSDNQKNAKLRADNTSGVVGVSWCKNSGKWISHICSNSRRKKLGSFTNKEDAVKARKDAEVHLGFHLNHGKVA